MRPFNNCILLKDIKRIIVPAYYLRNYHNGTQCMVTFYLSRVCFWSKILSNIFLATTLLQCQLRASTDYRLK